MKNKVLMGILFLWRGIFTGRAGNMIPMQVEMSAVLANDVNDKYTQIP